MYSLIPSLEGLDCVYCGEPADHRDHVIPRSRGGHAEEGNIVPACHTCNESKSGFTPEEWLARGLYVYVS